MNNPEHNSSMPGITILGAGIAGLVLGHSLKKRGISALILEKAQSPSHHSYGLTLHPWAYQPLANVLGESMGSFRSLVAMDEPLSNRKGHLSNSQSPANPFVSFRAHRGRLEDVLRKGLDIKYKHHLTSIETSEQHQNIIKFKNGIPSITQSKTNLIVGADGVHSELRRLISPSFETTTLPYVVFNGRRNLSEQEFQKFYAPYMNETSKAQMLVPFQSHPYFDGQDMNILLQIHVNEYSPDSKNINISYTYSRPSFAALGISRKDPLHMADRSKDEATKIPGAFFEELKLVKGAGIAYPYLHAFDPVELQKDRLLHWLMRSGIVKLDELERYNSRHDSSSSKTEQSKAPAGNFILIGDAVHPTPILGGEGANNAIRDGLELGDHISRYGLEGITGFYTERRGDVMNTASSGGLAKRSSRWDTWRDAVNLSEKVIREMHGMPEV